jgi:hypothetical protein
MRESHRTLQENTGNIWNMEALFSPKIFQIFSDDFWKDPLGKHWKLSESTGKNPGNSRPEYCFQLPSIFRCKPAVSRRTSFTGEGKICTKKINKTFFRTTNNQEKESLLR